MNSGPRFGYEFVEHIPDDLQDHTLYVSIPFTTAVHKCACGCGEEIVTPLSPTGWKLIFDGETISLDPSIGNWSLACESHYWIRRNRVRWADQWDRDRIEAGRRTRKTERKQVLGSPTPENEPDETTGSLGVFGRLRRLWSSLIDRSRS